MNIGAEHIRQFKANPIWRNLAANLTEQMNLAHITRGKINISRDSERYHLGVETQCQIVLNYVAQLCAQTEEDQD